jgi:hypothetical protein
VNDSPERLPKFVRKSLMMLVSGALAISVQMIVVRILIPTVEVRWWFMMTCLHAALACGLSLLIYWDGPPRNVLGMLAAIAGGGLSIALLGAYGALLIPMGFPFLTSGVIVLTYFALSLIWSSGSAPR